MSIATDTSVARQFIYRFEDLRRELPERPSAHIRTMGLSSTADVAPASVPESIVIAGERVQVALVRMNSGAVTDVFSNPGEQFQYILEGELIVDIDGRLVRVPKHHAVHVPARLPCRIFSSANAPVLMYSVQDARTPFALPPLAENREVTSASAQTDNESGQDVTYAYAIGELDRVPEGLLSATVTPRNYISKKSTSFGAALSGERIHVAVIGKVRATGTKLHTHPNEQFSFVLQGQGRYEIDGQTAEAPKGSVTHIPPGTVHGVVAYPEEDVLTFVAKDTSHGMSGPPIDGKEDGPVYWPGFDPRTR
jgi:quercetin dioxygenase-like cupin family protein